MIWIPHLYTQAWNDEVVGIMRKRCNTLWIALLSILCAHCVVSLHHFHGTKYYQIYYGKRMGFDRDRIRENCSVMKNVVNLIMAKPWGNKLKTQRINSKIACYSPAPIWQAILLFMISFNFKMQFMISIIQFMTL